MSCTGISFILLLLGVAPMFMGTASAQDMRVPDPNHEQTIRAIAACGVPPGNIRITYEDELQSDLVRIGDLGGSDEARFRCLREAVDPSYIVDASASAQNEAYRAFSLREDRREAKAEAIAWLAARGKLGKVLRFDPAGGPEKFARAIEAACSIRRGSALETLGESGLTIRPDFLEKTIRSSAHDQFTCLLKMTAASDADTHDVHLMMVGNEAYPMETPR
jgi:hypothetical protein